MSYKVNKEKCLGVKNCGVCIQSCPGATKEGSDGKAEVADQEKLEQCGGESVCPMGAIEKADGDSQPQAERQAQPPFPGQGRGMGAGRGRGLGRGPRDGRGRGMGGGGRR